MIFETGFWTVSVEDDTGLSRGECGGPAEAVVIPDCGENPESAGWTNCCVSGVCRTRMRASELFMDKWTK